ncbi:MAG TPA: hypothetical protein VG734_21005 [Lacunisphaera sp.]|nr:hypothetical protein [Lacunisphaera sp.]
MRLLRALALSLATLAAASARDGLREIVHPTADLPAFRCLVPADWESKVDAAGNLQLANPAHSAFFSLSFAHTSKPADAHDALARAVFGNATEPPWESREAVEVSGHRGFRYAARMKSGKANVRAELLVVEAGPGHLASCSTIINERIKPEDETTARLVQAALKLIVESALKDPAPPP